MARVISARWSLRAGQLSFFFLVMLAPTPCGLAQSGSQGAPTLPTFKTSATNVVVDVVVTGQHGAPVEDLTRDSFTVLEDGQVQKIVSFEAHPSSTPSPPSPLASPPVGVYTNAQVVPTNDAVDVLLIDSLNTPTMDQARSHALLVEYLKTLPANKPIAVFTLDTQLRQLEDFTTDHTALLKAVEDVTRLPNKSSFLKTRQDAERQRKDEDDKVELGLALKPELQAMAQRMLLNLQDFNAANDSFNISLRVQYTLGALDQLARYLSGMPGRKNILWLSGSFPLPVLPDPNPDLKNYQSTRDFSKDVERTANLLATARVAVYPIDARGLFPQSLALASASAGSSVRSPQRNDADQTKEQDLHAEERMTLEEVARVTGGEAVSNTNGLKGALAEVDQSGTHYYTVTYVPSHQAQDDKVRRIEVRVNPGKYHLSYRRTYVAAQTVRQDDMFSVLLQHNTPASTQILFRLSPVRMAAPPENAPLFGSNPNLRRPVTRYSIGYDVDVAPLQLVNSGDGVLHGTATLVTIVYDRDGKPVNSTSKTLNLKVPSVDYPQFLKQGLQYQLQLDIPAQAAWLRAGIFDQSSGIAGSLEVPFLVPAK